METEQQIMEMLNKNEAKKQAVEAENLALQEKLVQIRVENEKYRQEEAFVTERISNIMLNNTGSIDTENISQKINNFIIAADTQVGKTQKLIDACKLVLNENHLIFISCDNRIDQMNQLINRYKKQNVTVHRLSKRNMPEKVELAANSLADNRAVIFVILNNAAQIRNAEWFIGLLKLKTRIRKYTVFHDEGDMVNKADSRDDIANPSIAESHRLWISHMEHIQRLNRIDVINRFWVSATPDNCSELINIYANNIILLPKPTTYRTISNHVAWDYNDETFANNMLKSEIERVRRNNIGEVILYCVDNHTQQQIDMAKYFAYRYDCIGCSYNSKGITFYKKVGDIVKGFVYKQKDISLFLKYIKNKNKPVVIVGYDLINRGISFVGSEKDSPLAATVMFYKGTNQTPLVTLDQRFGRLSGTARSEITERVIYCSQRDWDEYVNYKSVKKQVFDSLESYGNMTMNEIASTFQSNPTRRNVDRKTMPSVNQAYRTARISNTSSQGSSSESSSTRVEENDVMKKLIKTWIYEKSIISKVLKYFYDHNGVNICDLEKFLNENGSKNPLQFIKHLTTKGKEYRHVFEKKNENYILRAEAREYYKTLVKK